MPSHRHVFLAGLHRSGTSLLHELLRAHPAISGFCNTGVPEDEGQHLQSVYLPAKAFGGAGMFGFDERAWMDERHPLATEQSAAKLDEQWGKHWDPGRQYLLEKSPPNLVRTRFLQALFPDASFIVLLRHPIAVALATEKWSRTRLPSLIEHWLVCHERFLADMAFLRRVYVLRYEELVARPQESLRELFAFLGLEPAAAEREIRPDINAHYFRQWQERKKQLSARLALAATAWKFEGRVRRLGYSLKEPEVLFPAACLGPHENPQESRP
jgi:hypothetical protein